MMTLPDCPLLKHCLRWFATHLRFYNRSISPSTRFVLVRKPFSPSTRSFIPITYLARFDANDDAKKLFGQIWDECGASITLYLSDVVDVLVAALDDSRWTTKKQGAAAIAALSEVRSQPSVPSKTNER